MSQNDKYQHFLRLNFKEFERVESLIGELYKEYNNLTPDRHTMVTALFQILVTYLSRCCETKSLVENDNAEFKIASSVSYMEKNFKTDISIKQLAEMSYLSERHFMRFFQMCITQHHTAISSISGFNMPVHCSKTRITDFQYRIFPLKQVFRAATIFQECLNRHIVCLLKNLGEDEAMTTDYQ